MTFMRKGAFDCVDKNRLDRLPLAVALAVEEKTRREERNRAEKELRHSEAHYRALAENPTYGICQFDVDGRFLDVNEALVAMLGYGSKEELMAVNLATEIIRDPIERAQLFESYRQTGHVDLIEVEWKRKDGTPMKVRLSGRQVGIEEGVPGGCEIIAEDVTAQRASEDHLRHLAATDALTGLANYRRLSETLESEIKRSERTARTFAVLIFDLNGMKRINDVHGHLAGNRALCRLADIFASPADRLTLRRDMGATSLQLFCRRPAPKKPTRSDAGFCERLSNDCEHIEEWRAGLKPHEKIERLEALKAQGHRVLMVGDGLNDAPALAAAHASVSPSSAADISQTASDAVIQGAHLMPVVELLATARKTRKMSFQNFAVALGYNLVFVPLAMAGFVTPLVAAIAMSTSSILVTLNAIRLRTARLELRA